jgi:orotate phosphoribosyltransferase
MANIAALLLKAKAVTLRVNPPYTWTSGIKAPIYTDNRIMMSYVKERNTIVDAFITLIKNKKIRCDGIAATATAGIPWGAWIADKLNLPLIYVRGSAKGHGKENTVEGRIQKGKTYLVVEDLISTGGSSVSTAEVVRREGGTVKQLVAIFTYQLHASSKNFKDNKIEAFTLSTFTELIDTAVKTGYLKEKDKTVVMQWKENPERWGQ